MDSLIAFYEYLKHPRVDLSPNTSVFESIQNVVFLFIVVFVAEIVLLFPLLGFLGVNEMDHAMESIMETMSSWSVVLLAVVAAPLIEEVIFRYPLKNKWLLEVLIMAFLAVAATLFFNNVLTIGWIGVILVLSLRLMWVLGPLKDLLKVSNASSSFDRNFPTYFYGVAVFFAFVHIFNFNLDASDWYLTPILVMPQFVLGLLLGYVRMKYGTLYSILVHGMNNAIPIILMIFFKDML